MTNDAPFDFAYAGRGWYSCSFTNRIAGVTPHARIRILYLYEMANQDLYIDGCTVFKFLYIDKEDKEDIQNECEIVGWAYYD